MTKALIEFSKNDLMGKKHGSDESDSWVAEVLLDTMSFALHLPMRIVFLDRVEDICRSEGRLLTLTKSLVGADSGIMKKIFDLSSNMKAGLLQIGSNEDWSEVETFFNRQRVIIQSNSDPFWTILRGLDVFRVWEKMWLVAKSYQNSDTVVEIAPPFGDAFLLVKVVIPEYNICLFAGPVWNWGLCSSVELGLASTSGGAVDNICEELSDHIHRHVNDVSEGKPVGIFSEERLRHNIMSRPPMMLYDLTRRIDIASTALKHAFSAIVDEPPSVNLITSVGIAALHLAYRLNSGATEYRNQTKVWHRIDASSGSSTPRKDWLVTSLNSTNGVVHVSKSAISNISPPKDDYSINIDTANSGKQNFEVLTYCHLVVDYGMGRSAYSRERMMIIRLWTRDNFARWLTTSNLPKTISYTERVDALAYQIAVNFVADRCSIFRYDAEQRTLDRLGRYSRDQDNDYQIRSASSDQIRQAGLSELQRKISPRYQAIDRTTPICLLSSRDDSRRLDGARIGSRIVVPILVFGRPWGVIEIVGLRSHQFLESATPWLDEFSKLLGQDLYNESILNDLHEISRSALKENSKNAQYMDVLRYLARIFVASSGALYLQHPRRTAEFTCVAFFGRPGDMPNGALSGFNIEDPISNSAKILRENRREWVAGRVGEDPFDGGWPIRLKTKSLIDEGHEYVALMPLRNGKEQVIGCIALTAREGGPFVERFRPLAEFATRYAGVAIEAISLKHLRSESVRELMAHSLKSRVDRVETVAASLERLLLSFFGEAGDARRLGKLFREIDGQLKRSNLSIDGDDRQGEELFRSLQRAFGPEGQDNFSTVLTDLRSHTLDLRRTATFLIGDAVNEENPYETTEQKWSGTPTALRDCLLGCVVPLAREKGIDIVLPPPQVLGFEIRVRISPIILSDIINNFCDNALKYSLTRTPPMIRFRWTKGWPGYLEFRNLAPKLTTDEETNLGFISFRSVYAKSRSADGHGLGLISNRKLAERWGMNIYHRQVPTRSETNNNVWHVFGLEIPDNLLFEDPTQRFEERSKRQ